MAYKIVDVSSWQGDIDWSSVKASGVTGAIIRFADGMYVPRDSKFDANMAGAHAAGLHVGVYIFSRAANAAQAVEEADRTIDAALQYGVDLPIYIDMEDPDYAGVANEVASAFLNRCSERGVKGGIYANLNWFNNYIDVNAFADYPLWIAQYNDRITHSNPGLFGMWQYTDSEYVPGIGNCDCNELYVEYWNNGATALPTPAPQPTAPQASGYVWTVWNIQCWANICNYGAPDMDNIDGPETGRCVGNGQRAYGIPDDEKFGEVTQAHAEAQVRGYQQRLKELGFYYGDTDGIPGPQTYQAVKDFQASVGLAADGIVGEQTYPALFGSGTAGMTPEQEPVTLKNFTPDEFKSECGCGGDIKNPLKLKIQQVRDILSVEMGKDCQIVITSGFRCADQNARDGGVPDSLHLSGDACDLYTPGMSDEMVDRIARIAQSVGLGTIRYYSSQFVHVQLYPRDTIGD